MNTLNQIYVNFCNKAKNIPGFKIGQKEDVQYDITELANGFVKAQDNNDKEGMENYASALMVRYWHMVPYLYNQSKSARLSIEDMVSWIWEGFAKAFKYRSWLDSGKEVSKDKKGAEKCFNQCITSVRQNYYRHFNRDCAKINYVSYSIEDLEPTTKYEALKDTDLSNDTCRDIITALISKGNIFEAVVVDSICFGESFSKKKQNSSVSYNFDMKKLITSIKSKDLQTFSEEYNLPLSKVSKVVDTNINNKNCSKNIQEALYNLRNNKEVLSILC